MRSIEPIIRLVKYQLTEILPLAVEQAGPAQNDDDADPTTLYLPPPAQVRNSFRAIELRSFPALIISPTRTSPVAPEAFLDDPGADCKTYRHEFDVLLVLSGSESEVEDLTYKLSRYVGLVQTAVCEFEAQALLNAFTASQLDSTPVEIIPGDVLYEEPDDKSYLLRTATMSFTAYC